jgi:hypothetical protein
MTVTETLKAAVGLPHEDAPSTTASRTAMATAKLPLAYRDSCAGLLIPLNRCRFETYYLPWKCEVPAPSNVYPFIPQIPRQPPPDLQLNPVIYSRAE